MRATRVLVVVAMAGLFVAACGDDDGESITKDDFVEQANAICADGNDELDAAGEDVDFNDEDAFSAFVTDELVPSVRQQIADIRDLGFPEGDEDELDAILDDASADVDNIEDDPASVGEAFSNNEDPFDDVNQRLNDYGLTECGSTE
jgi:hypothetical protein